MDELQLLQGNQSGSQATIPPLCHVLRSRYDAIAVGVGTVIADDPELSCRLPDWTGGQPLRLVFDTHLRTPTCACLVRTADKTPGWIMTSEQAPKERKQVLEQAGIRVVEQPLNAQKTVDLVSSLIWLKQQGLDSLMVEGGGALAASFIRRGVLMNWPGFVRLYCWGGMVYRPPVPCSLKTLRMLRTLSLQRQKEPVKICMNTTQSKKIKKLHKVKAYRGQGREKNR